MPTREQVERLIAALDAINNHELARKLTIAVRRDAVATTRRDGFPSGGAGGGDTTVKWCFEHERGDCACAVSIDAPNDPTGNAASGPDPFDVLHDDVTTALAHLDNAVHHLQAVQTVVIKLDSYQQLADRTAPPGCAVMSRVGVWEPVHRTPSISGKPVPLGLWAYKFFHNHDRLPNDGEAEQHALGKKVHVRKGPEHDTDERAESRRKRMIRG